jgi:hypothetical protein
VLFVTSTVIAHLLSMMRLELLQSTPLLDRHCPLPATLNQVGVVFRAALATAAVLNR